MIPGVIWLLYVKYIQDIFILILLVSKGDTWTELPLARCMSETFGTIHTEYEKLTEVK